MQAEKDSEVEHREFEHGMKLQGTVGICKTFRGRIKRRGREGSS